MNIMSLLAGSWPHVMEQICARRLGVADVPLREQATVVLYLVSPDYALRAGPAYEFALDADAAAAHGCEVFFSSAVAAEAGSYRTVGTSRAVALATAADTLEQARASVAAVAATVPVLEWRRDVGAGSYLDALRPLVASARPDSPAARDARGEPVVSNPG
jgi:phosphoribosylamine-glycine ligase